jgi:hypothetical protein
VKEQKRKGWKRKADYCMNETPTMFKGKDEMFS